MLSRLREICMALPDVVESTMHGHPVFRIKDKSFCIWHGPDGEPAIALKVAKSEQAMFLEDPRFHKTPYIGQHGWISLPAKGRLNWTEVKELVAGSYRLAVPRVKRKS